MSALYFTALFGFIVILAANTNELRNDSNDMVAIISSIISVVGISLMVAAIVRYYTEVYPILYGR
jgi:hypothetical protein